MPTPSPEPTTPPSLGDGIGVRREKLLTFLRWSTLALLIWCIKLWVIRQHGDSCPFGDEWPWEADSLLKPFQEHNLTWSHFFAPINEHRILMTRLFVLALFKLNGLWDPRLQMAAQALLHASGITLFLFLCTRGLIMPLRLLFIGATCLLWLLPFGWENTLFGFQSQFYFVILFGIATLWLTWRHETLSRGWWLALLVAIAGFFTMASGLFACAISAALILSRAWAHPTHLRRELTGFAIFAAITIGGFLLVPHVPYSDQFKARDVSELLDAWRFVLSWPEHGHWFFLILQAPVVLLIVRMFRERPPIHHRAWLVLSFAGWGILQSIALAYGRGHLTPVAPRYLDVYVLLLCSSFACFCEWYQGIAMSPRPRRCALALGGIWMLCVMHGALSHFIGTTLSELANWTSVKHAQENTVVQFLESHDKALLTSQPIPYPAADPLAGWLQDPTIIDLLPTSMRPALSSSRQISENSFFNRSYFDEGGNPTPGHLRYWSSYGPLGNAQTGEMEIKFQSIKRPRLLEFFVAGAPNADGMSLLLTGKSDAPRPLAPHHGVDVRWESVLVKIPPRGFSIIAKDSSPDQWLAVSNPREVGLLSHYLGEFLQLPDSTDTAWFTLPLFTALVAAAGLLLALGRPLERPNNSMAPRGL